MQGVISRSRSPSGRKKVVVVESVPVSNKMWLVRESVGQRLSRSSRGVVTSSIRGRATMLAGVWYNEEQRLRQA